MAAHPLRLGLLGMGCVGGGVMQILARHGAHIAARTGIHLCPVRALVRDPTRPRPAAPELPLTGRAEDIVGAADVDVVVELMGGLSPACELVEAALRAGQSVVTANKAVLARHAGRLLALACEHNVELLFEAAVAGGLPVVRLLREGLVGDHVTSLRGILNGTTNSILDAMAEGHGYAAALAAAQARGIAEADPHLDVSGIDAAEKLCILAQLAFGVALDPAALAVVGIAELTPEVMADAAVLGCRVRLVAWAERGDDGQVAAAVQPTLVRERDPLYAVPGATNALAIGSEALGDTLYVGAGAGALPTGSAVVADLVEAGRARRAGIGGRIGGPAAAAPAEGTADARRQAHYIRLQIDDRPGVLARVAALLAAADVSLATVRQAPGAGGGAALVLTTHPTTRAAMAAAGAALRRHDAVRSRPSVLPLGGRPPPP